MELSENNLFDKTYEEILEEMLEKVDDKYDKRPGSYIHTAISVAALYYKKTLEDIKLAIDESYADTQTIDYLKRRANERLIEINEATAAILQMQATPDNIQIDIGERIDCGNAIYKVIENIGNGLYNIECEENGEIGNSYKETITSVNYIEGLEKLEIKSVLKYGENEEDVEHLRERYYNSFSYNNFGGNRADYLKKIKSIDGVGGVKLYRVDPTTKKIDVYITNKDYNVASEELVNKVQQEIDPQETTGQGYGLAPIGHSVKIYNVEKQSIVVQLNIKAKDGANKEEITNKVREALKNYFMDLNKKWDKTEEIVVRMFGIEIAASVVDDIEDITSVLIDHQYNNKIIDANKIVDIDSTVYTTFEK